MKLRLLIVTPAGIRSRTGNRRTAERWARILRQLGHSVTISEEYDDRQPCDVLIALHARRSLKSIRRFHATRSARPLLVALTGTDIYHDLQRASKAGVSLEMATRLVLLQPDARRFLPEAVLEKSCVIFQSAIAPKSKIRPLVNCFEVSVIGHLRPVKDPFRSARAARLLPSSSRIRVIQIGFAHSESMRRQAELEMERNSRYHWLGELPAWKARQRLARSRLMILSSKLEGGANVVSEAIAAGVPVISTRISGSLGILGNNYPGYFEVGETRQLSELMNRAELDRVWYRELRNRCRALARLVKPSHEAASWKRLIQDLIESGELQISDVNRDRPV